jgi:hypothetical protein
VSEIRHRQTLDRRDRTKPRHHLSHHCAEVRHRGTAKGTVPLSCGTAPLHSTTADRNAALHKKHCPAMPLRGSAASHHRFVMERFRAVTAV